MKKIIQYILFFVLSFSVGYSDDFKYDYLGKVVAMTSTKNPTTQFHIVYIKQDGIVSVIENLDLGKQIFIQTTDYTIYGYIVRETKETTLKTEYKYYIVDKPLTDKQWEIFNNRKL